MHQPSQNSLYKIMLHFNKKDKRKAWPICSQLKRCYTPQVKNQLCTDNYKKQNLVIHLTEWRHRPEKEKTTKRILFLVLSEYFWGLFLSIIIIIKKPTWKKAYYIVIRIPFTDWDDLQFCFINYFYCLVFSQLSVFPFVLNPITFTLIFLPLIKVSLDSSSYLNVC